MEVAKTSQRQLLMLTEAGNKQLLLLKSNRKLAEATRTSDLLSKELKKLTLELSVHQTQIYEDKTLELPTKELKTVA